MSLKRIQACAFQEDIKDANTRVAQIDYAMAYQCQQQSEVQSALWARGSVNIFTCTVYHNYQTKTFLVCRNYKGKDKFSNGTFLEYLYENELQHVIWSDDPTAEFKNKFMHQFIENLSLKCNKFFTWKYSATSHGKGVVDGIDGKVKSTVHSKVVSQGKNRLVVLQDTQSFVSTAKKLLGSTKIMHIGEQKIVASKDSNPFKSAIEVKGILKMHMIEVDGEKAFLWQNCAFHTNSKPADIVLNKVEDMEVEYESIDESIATTYITYQMNLYPFSYDDVKIGKWVINIYENEKWLGNVVNKKANQICVHCLEKPYGVNEPQNLEREEDRVFFDQVFNTDVVSILFQIDANGKKERNGFWRY